MGDGFDIPQGSFHGGEVCKLVGVLILNKIEKDYYYIISKIYANLVYLILFNDIFSDVTILKVFA